MPLLLPTYTGNSLDVSAKSPSPREIKFSTDGTNLYITGSTSTVDQYKLGSAWDLSTATFYRTIDIFSQDFVPRGLAFSSDGTKMFVAGAWNKKIYQYTLSTPWDISTASYASIFLSYNPPVTDSEIINFGIILTILKAFSQVR